MRMRTANLIVVLEHLCAVLAAMPPYLRAAPGDHQAQVRAMLAKQYPQEAAELDRTIADYERRATSYGSN
jgi:hypothetical protein